MTGMKQAVVAAVGIVVATAGLASAGQQPYRGNTRHLISGTYQLDRSQGDDPRRAAEQASRDVAPDQRQRTYESLLARLEAPDVMAIERNGNSVSMASTRGPRVTVEADGRNNTEQWATDRTMNTRATLYGERLTITTAGHRGSAFTVTFEPMSNGRSLNMTRTIDDESLRRPVTVRSTYRRVSNDAQWNIEASGGRGPYSSTGFPAGGAGVPDGTLVVAMLDDDMSTRNVFAGDLYTMTVLSPSRYEGAVIQGVVSIVGESGQTDGRAGMTLDIQSIRLRNGRTYQFDGIIEQVRTPDGDMVRVGREGTIGNHDSQTEKIVQRSVIGAALGAMIGAVVGGGKGAAIGAAVGAGGGAGTVMIEGRNRLDLPRGTEVTIRSGTPSR